MQQDAVIKDEGGEASQMAQLSGFADSVNSATTDQQENL